MSRVLVNTNDMSRTEWLTWRRKGIGGSDAAAVCGVSRWSSPIKVWKDKTDDFPPEVGETNMNMELGTELEDFVATKWMQETGKKCQRRNSILMHDEYDFMLANIDRWVVGENAGLEIKTATSGTEWKDGAIPIEYEMQCMHYMAVTGADRWYLCCLIVGYGKHLEFRTIERDDEAIGMLMQAEKNFWEHVEKKVMPAPSGSDDDDEIIRDMYPAEHGKEVDLTDMAQDLKRYDEVKELLDKLTREQKEIAQRIQIRMDDAEIAIIGERRITWKEQKGRVSVDSKSLERDHPELFHQYARTGKPYRVFRVQ